MELFSPSSFFFILAIIFPSFQLSESSNTYDEKYETCKKPFKCGTISNITYPFYDGQNRPEFCGYPGFQLHCTNLTAEIYVVSSEMYNVLGMKNDSPILTVAREDWEGYCPKSFTNTSINFTLFNYVTIDENITLYYDCPEDLSTSVSNNFSCSNINGDYSPKGYFKTKYLENIPGHNNILWDSCKNNIFVPFINYQSADARVTDEASLIAAVRNGFELEWFAENSLCDECSGSGGQCGYNTSTSRFTCYCPDRPYDYECPGKSSKKAVIIGVSAGGIGLVAVLLVCCWSLFIVRRRKRLISQARTKHLGPVTSSSGLHSSNGFRSSQGFMTSPSTYLSQSIPSYPSSKSDLENGSAYFGVKIFSYIELEEATKNFDESRELGDGAFGTVYYGELPDGRLVAVKRLYENSCKRMGQFMNEIKILAHLRHKNLVTLYGCTSRRSRELLLVYEYIPNGTVADHLHGKLVGSDKLTWPIRVSIALETADALAYLHASDIIHRDVKTTNILLDDNFQVKVADFGLSRLFPTDVTHVSTAPQGTPGYVDPEYYQCYHLTEKSDVYSFGVVIMELISSKPAVDITRHRHDINLANMALDRIQNHALHELVDPSLGYDKDYIVKKMVTSAGELAFRCLQQDREMRPSMQEVVEALRDIQKEMENAHKQVVLDIQENEDNVGLLKNAPPPVSPETEVNGNWQKGQLI